MADYKLTDNGVFHTATGRSIPNDTGNRDWNEYINWTNGLDANGVAFVPPTGPQVADPADVPDWNSEGRGIRNNLLTSSDWTQGNDTPLTTAKVTEWATYRTSLRDLPVTYTNYSTVVWPTVPAP